MGIAAEDGLGQVGHVGGHQHHFAGNLMVDHVTADMLGAAEGAHQVDVNDALEFGLRHIVDMGEAPNAAGSNQNVHGAIGFGSEGNPTDISLLTPLSS